MHHTARVVRLDDYRPRSAAPHTPHRCLESDLAILPADRRAALLGLAAAWSEGHDARAEALDAFRAVLTPAERFHLDAGSRFQKITDIMRDALKDASAKGGRHE